MAIVDHQTRVILGTQRARVSPGGSPSEEQKGLSALFEEFSDGMSKLRIALNSENPQLQSFLALVAPRDASGENGDAELKEEFTRLDSLKKQIVAHPSYATREDEMGTDIFDQEKDMLGKFTDLRIAISGVRHAIGQLM